MTELIRFAELSDAAAIQAIYAPFCETSAVSFETVAPTVDQMCERISRTVTSYPWLVCELGGDLAGYVYACPHHERAAYRWSVDVAVYVASQYHRRGFGRALYTSLFSMLRAQDLFKAYAGIALPNRASVGMHEALGFRPVAVFRDVGFKLGQWHDVGWWCLELQPEVPEPREPQPIDALRGTPAVEAAIAEGQRLLGR